MILPTLVFPAWRFKHVHWMAFSAMARKCSTLQTRTRPRYWRTSNILTHRRRRGWRNDDNVIDASTTLLTDWRRRCWRSDDNFIDASTLLLTHRRRRYATFPDAAILLADSRTRLAREFPAPRHNRIKTFSLRQTGANVTKLCVSVIYEFSY